MKSQSTAALIVVIGLVTMASCKKATSEPISSAQLIFKFKFDSAQIRLNNIGQPSPMAAGHAGQNPVFNKMSAHYVEMAPNAGTALGAGAVLYKALETTMGGATAIDFEKAAFAGNNEVFYSVPIKDIKAGDYQWLRISLAYQNFDINYFVDTTINTIKIRQVFPATVAGFIGYNTYIKTMTVKNQSIPVNANKKQGFWAFETAITYKGLAYPYATSGQSPEGATTVVNPLFASSPIPQGSCVVTTAFTPGKLIITGKETKDIVVEVSLSTNKSFEWNEVVADGLWEPAKGENIVDMGIRGMISVIK